MSATGKARPPAHLIALIAGITVIPLVMLLWVGWRLFEQDRVLERQQVQQRVDRAADVVVASLQRAIAATEQRLASGSDRWPDGAVAVTFRDDGAEAIPPGRVAYLPRVNPGRETHNSAFVQAEDLEFRQRDPGGAIRILRELARADDLSIRAGALLRLARNLQVVGQADEALDAYARLGAVDVSLDGVPTELMARFGRCRLLEKLNRIGDLRSEAADLAAALHSGRWALTAPVYWLYSGDAVKWTGARSVQAHEAEAFADALATLWDRWRSRHAAAGETAGRETLRGGDRTFVALSQTTNGALRAVVVASSFIESQWLSPLAAILNDAQVSIEVRDTSGKPLFGRATAQAAPIATRRAAESALPFSVTTASLEPPREARDFAVRRRLLIAGFVLLVLMASIAGYVIVRAVNREVAVARLQSDFVSAVSHEFRTPLTSLRQFTDMLRENPVMDDQRRRVAYDAQARATDRLMRLVESLLDFGRMEAGARRYRFESRDCTDLVRRVVDDFRREAAVSGHVVEFSGNGGLPLDVDDEALSRAVRNLLDNAVKYSPDPRPIEVAVARRDREAAISVKDRGIGIPAHERASIFSKFHRGEQARTRGIKGTGIGLAMVDEIVRAHQGHIDVASEPGNGSTFTIVLPLKA